MVINLLGDFRLEQLCEIGKPADRNTGATHNYQV